MRFAGTIKNSAKHSDHRFIDQHSFDGSFNLAQSCSAFKLN